MLKGREETRCTSARVFLWNEQLTRNQISESEGLCVIKIEKYKRLGGRCYYRNTGKENSCCSTVIPFELSRLLNKDSSLFSMLLSATLQFPPKFIIQLTKSISNRLFTRFQFSQPPPPRPTYVIALEISHTICTDSTSDELPWDPPPIPLFRRFEKDWDEEEELFSCVGSVSTTDFMNDPYHNYCYDVLDYIFALREYTGEAGICPTKPPIAPDVPKGLVEVEHSLTRIHNDDNNRDLMDDTCPICYDDFKDKNEVLTTNCLHDFHTKCLLSWLTKNNTCPTCRAVYPLHYWSSSNCRKRSHHNSLQDSNKRHKHNISEASL